MIEYRELTCDVMPDQCRDEEFFYNEINKQLEEKFHIGMMLPIVFIDSFAKHPNNSNDATQQEHFQIETEKAWNFSKTSPEFQFKTIDEILEENYEMRDEIEWLNEVITKNISDLQESLANEMNIREQQVKDLNGTTGENTDRIDDEETRAKAQEKTIEDDISINHNNITSLEKRTDFLENPNQVILTVSLVFGDSNAAGCDWCSMDIEIYDKYGYHCENSIWGEFHRNTQYTSMAAQMHECRDWTAYDGVDHIKVTHGSDDGVHVQEWYITGSTKTFRCPDDNWYDDSDSKTLDCY